MPLRERVFQVRRALYPARVKVHRALAWLDLTEPGDPARPTFRPARAGGVSAAGVSPVAALAAIIVLVLAFDTSFGPVGGSITDCAADPSGSSSASTSHSASRSAVSSTRATSAPHPSTSTSGSASASPGPTCPSPSASASSSASASHSGSASASRRAR